MGLLVTMTVHTAVSLGMFLISQVEAILSERDAHRLLWNRSACHRTGQGKNYPIDMQLEFYIRSMKLIIRKLGGNVRNTAILDRYAKSLSFNTAMMENFDDQVGARQKSGKHSATNRSADLHKVIRQLVAENAMVCIPGRRYRHYANIDMSLLSKLNIGTLFEWIESHKRKIVEEKTAR